MEQIGVKSALAATVWVAVLVLLLGAGCASGTKSGGTASHAFPTGTFETKITPADVRRVGGPTWWAHWETLTFSKNGTVRDVWFRPRRADQPTTGGRLVVHGNQVWWGRDKFHWSYYRGLLTLRIVKNVNLDTLGFLIFQTHPWRKIR